MKSCEQYELLASLALDGEASEEEQAELAAHLETCPACRTYVEDIQRIHRVFVRGEITVPEGFAVRVMERVRETRQDPPDEEEKKVVPFPHWRRWTALAACCAVVMLGVWTYWRAGIKDTMVSTDISLRAASQTSEGPANATPAAQEPDMSGIYEDIQTDGADIEPLNEAPPEIPEEYEELAKSAVRDNASEGQYQPLLNSTPESQQPSGAATPPAWAGNGEASDAPAAPETGDTDQEVAAEEDGAESAPEPEPQPEPEPEEQQPEPEPDPEDGPEEQAPPDSEPAEEPEETVETVEPVEVIGVPEPGVLIAYGGAAQTWVEDVLGMEWAAGGSYPLTAEQYGDLLRTLDEAGALYSIEPGEGYCLMTE